MILPALTMTLRLRMLTTALSALGVVVVILIVGALFPAVGGSIGKLDLPKGVTTLLGGADYATLTGWMRSEIGAVYGPLLLAYTGISVAASSTAGDEEAGILALTLAYPIGRMRLVLAKAAAVGSASRSSLSPRSSVSSPASRSAAAASRSRTSARVSLHLAFFGWAAGALALALGASPAGGRSPPVAPPRSRCSASSSTASLRSWMRSAWLRYVSLFYYYEGHDPIANGVDFGRSRRSRGRNGHVHRARDARHPSPGSAQVDAQREGPEAPSADGPSIAGAFRNAARLVSRKSITVAAFASRYVNAGRFHFASIVASTDV